MDTSDNKVKTTRVKEFEVEKWMYMNEDGGWLLIEDTPKELKEFHEKKKKKYSRFS